MLCKHCVAFGHGMQYCSITRTTLQPRSIPSKILSWYMPCVAILHAHVLRCLAWYQGVHAQGTLLSIEWHHIMLSHDVTIKPSYQMVQIRGMQSASCGSHISAVAQSFMQYQITPRFVSQLRSLASRDHMFRPLQVCNTYGRPGLMRGQSASRRGS